MPNIIYTYVFKISSSFEVLSGWAMLIAVLQNKYTFFLCLFIFVLIFCFKLNVVWTRVHIRTDMGIQGKGIKMMFGKQRRNFCSLQAFFFLTVEINRVTLGYYKQVSFNACCIPYHVLNCVMVKIHDQGPEQLQEKLSDKTETEEPSPHSYALFLAVYGWNIIMWGFRNCTHAKQLDLVSYCELGSYISDLSKLRELWDIFQENIMKVSNINKYNKTHSLITSWAVM